MDTNEELKEKAISKFGVTEDFSEAFFILDDGRMLDGSLGSKGRRIADHMDIRSVYEVEPEGGDFGFFDFMKRGNVRARPEAHSLQISAEPTYRQRQLIYKLVRTGKVTTIEVSPNPETFEGYYLTNIMTASEAMIFISRHFEKEKA